MKNVKKILSIIVIISMLASMFITTSFATEKAAYELGIISYTDADGASLKTLNGVSTIKATSSVTASAGGKVLFAVGLYNGDTLEASDTAAVTVTAGKKEALEATIALEEALPNPATGYTVRTFVWEGSTAAPIIKENTFPNSNVALASLTIDGTEMTIEDAMTYQVPVGQMIAPEIVAKAADASTAVTVTNPVKFPGSATVTLAASDGTTKDYVINYTAESGVTSTVESDFYGRDFHEPGDNGSTYGSRLYHDRPDVPQGSANNISYYNDIREICDELDYLKGSDYIMAGRDKKATHSFTLGRAATVRVIHRKNYAEASLSGWQTTVASDFYAKISYTLGSGVEGHKDYKELMVLDAMTYKTFAKGDTVSFTTPCELSIVVIEYVDYIADPEVSLSTLTAGGNVLMAELVNKTEFEYGVSADALTAPEVTAQAIDPEANVEVIYPGEKDNKNYFPGKTIVRVTKGNKTKDYTVKYTNNEAKLTNASSNYATGFHAADDANASVVSGYLVGSKLYSDRVTPTINAAGLAYFNDIRAIADEWDYLNGTDYFMSKVGGKVTSTFTLNRDAVVRVFSNSGTAVSDTTWTKEYNNPNGYMAASVTSGQLTVETSAKFTVMFYKKFKKGDEVSITTNPQEAMVVVDYCGYLIEPATALKSLNIGETSYEGLDLTEKEYEYTVSLSETVVPSVDAEAYDDNATVEIIYPGQKGNPNIFPGKTIVRVTNGAKTKDYTVKYVSATSGIAEINIPARAGTNLHAADDSDALKVSDSAATPTSFTFGSWVLQDRAQYYKENSGADKGKFIYFNDVRTISDEYDYLHGAEYIMSAVTNDKITFKLSRDAVVRVFNSDGAMNTDADTWTKEIKHSGYMTASISRGQGMPEGYSSASPACAAQKFNVMYYKNVKVGEEVNVQLNTFNCLIVIEYTGYTSNELSLASLTVGGKTQTIGKGTLWEYIIDSDATMCPKVEATAASDATVEVIYPFDDGNANIFPGKTIIRVSKRNKVAEYIVKYVCREELVTNTSSTGVGYDTNYVSFGTDFHEASDEGYANGSKYYYDRDCPVIGAYTNDIREICDELDYLKGTDYIMAGRSRGFTHTFTLGRDAVVRVIHAAGGTPSSFEGWESSKKSTGYLKVSHTTGAGMPGHKDEQGLLTLNTMTWKSFGKGEEVTITLPDNHAIAIIEYTGVTE